MQPARAPTAKTDPRFARDGYLLLPAVLTKGECADLMAHIAPEASVSGGTRRLLSQPWCAALAARLRGHPAIAALLPTDAVSVQCTYFEKSHDHNWLVPIHQDLSIPVAQRVAHPELRGWSEKEGNLFVQPPAHVLENLLAVRLHLDDCGPQDGALRVLPGSHLGGRVGAQAAVSMRAEANNAVRIPDDAVADGPLGEVTCLAATGDALLMRPLLLHASSKASGTSKRRILHFLFGPGALPCGLRWPDAT